MLGLLIVGLMVFLEFATPRMGFAEAPNPSGQGAVKTSQKDETAGEPTPRDASGRLVINGTVVDESGAPVPKARVRLHSYQRQPATSLADAQGRFQFPVVELPTARYLTFVAENLKDRAKGSVTILEEGTLDLTAPIQIVVKPPRDLTVEVHDHAGAPVEGALIEISTLLHFIDEGRTGSDGTLQFNLPGDADIGTVLALKSGVGFDYWNRVDQKNGPRAIPEKLTFTLNGACKVRIHALDSQGSPVPAIRVVPWTVSKPGQTDYANLSGFFSEFERVQTDANGIATIDWLPREFANRITFLARSDDYHLPSAPSFEANANGDVVDLEMQLLRSTEISGTVRTADGKPAAGIVLQAEGRGQTNHYYRDLTRTNAEGEFTFRAYPDQSYLISVVDENWAAQSATIPELSEDQPVNGLELKLGRGTIVRGVATTADGRAQANATVTLIQSATMSVPDRTAQLVRWARTDAQGRYHFRIGPGTYELFSPGHKEQVPLKIERQPEVVQDFRAKE
ncbi:MAG: carboxypeptidase regulatory-like domain-containing protein [Planctomycetales bacterium]